MIAVNLTPQSRQLARRYRARLRTWIVCCAGYCLFLVVAFIVSTVLGTGDDAIVRVELTNVHAERQTVEQSSLVLQSRLDQAAEQLGANRAVGNQPDWGILLALLGSTVADDIVLRKVSVQSMSERTPAPAPAGRSAGVAEPNAAPETEEVGTTHIELSGLGLTQEDISTFVLRLDQIDLFSRVKLMDTKREPFLGGFATGFRVQCALSDAGDAGR